MDLKLPEIEPARVVPSAADAIDRAGAKFKDAADAWGQVALQAEVGKLTVESQEATIQRSREESDKLDFIQKNPYVTVDAAKKMFPNGLPAGVKTEEPDGSPRVIPMSELAVAYFDQEAPGVTERAAAHISAPGWRQRFKLAAQEDSNRKREKVVAFQRELQLADNELKTKLQYEQLMAARDFKGAEAILASDVTLGELERTKMREAHPAKKTLAVVLDRLQSGDVKELDSLISDLTENVAKPENGIFEPVPAESRYRIINQARDTKAAILAEQERAAKAAEEQEFLGYVGKAHAAALEAGKQNAPGSAVMGIDQIPIVMSNGRPMSDERYQTIQRILTADPARGTDMRYYGALTRITHTPGALGQMSFTDLTKLTSHLSAAEEREWMNKWAKDKAEPGAVKPPLPEYLYGDIRDAVNLAMDGKAKDDPVRSLQLEARLERALVNSLADNPRRLMKDDIFTMARQVANGAAPGFFRSKVPPAAQDEIARQLGRAKKKVTDTYVASEWEKIKATRADVQDAWTISGGVDDVPDNVLASTYYKLNDPKYIEKLKKDARARLDASGYGGAKQPVTEREIRIQAVLEDMGPETAPAREEAAVEAEKTAERRQLKDRRARLEKTAKALLTDTKNRPADLAAEFSRITALLGTPKPGTAYNYTAADIKKMQEQAALDYADKMDSQTHIVPAHKQVP